MNYLILALSLLGIYTLLRINAIARIFGDAVDKTNQEITELKTLIEKPGRSTLPEELSLDQWSGRPSKEEERHPLENPNPLRSPDAYTQALIMSELDARSNAVERVKFLTELRRAGAWFWLELVGTLLKDESPKVRAWIAANVTLRFNDYSDFDNPNVLADYEAQIKNDPDPLVRASVWRNTNCKQLPWSMIRLMEGWQEQVKGMTQLERLCLMRNPSLSFTYLVALVEADTAQLGIAHQEHAEMICAGATNPRIVWSSRHHGRDYWLAFGDPNPPFEEFGKMWESGFEKWMEFPPVPYVIVEFIQTTQKIKLASYERLLKMSDETRPQHLRAALIRGCDPFTDKDVLRRAWDDPDKDCREIARERVGHLMDFVGVSEKPKKL